MVKFGCFSGSPKPVSGLSCSMFWARRRLCLLSPGIFWHLGCPTAAAPVRVSSGLHTQFYVRGSPPCGLWSCTRHLSKKCHPSQSLLSPPTSKLPPPGRKLRLASLGTSLIFRARICAVQACFLTLGQALATLKAVLSSSVEGCFWMDTIPMMYPVLCEGWPT